METKLYRRKPTLIASYSQFCITGHYPVKESLRGEPSPAMGSGGARRSFAIKPNSRRSAALSPVTMSAQQCKFDFPVPAAYGGLNPRSVEWLLQPMNERSSLRLGGRLRPFPDHEPGLTSTAAFTCSTAIHTP